MKLTAPHALSAFRAAGWGFFHTWCFLALGSNGIARRISHGCSLESEQVNPNGALTRGICPTPWVEEPMHVLMDGVCRYLRFA